MVLLSQRRIFFEIMIKFEKVFFSYPGGQPVLKGIDLDIAKGEWVAMVGSNGSGKTTLALLINGILKADSGLLLVDNLNPSEREESRKLKQKVGLVFQNPDNQLVSSTVEREIAFSLENTGVPYDSMKEQVDWSLEFFELNHIRKRLTSELSGGEKQKVALAAVMVVRPDILILDEPGSYLDESGKNLLNRAINSLLKERPDLTLMHITQYASVAEKYTRLIAFNEGEIVDDGNPEEVFRRAKDEQNLGIGIPLKYRIMKKKLGKPVEKEDTGLAPGHHAANTGTISMDSVSYSYNTFDHKALFENISLDISVDRVYGLVGPSGSGKTTMLQIMAGLLVPQKGNVTHSGFSKFKNPVTMSFQQPERQFFKETVEQELRFGGENIGLPDIDEAVSSCYRLIGMDREKFSERNPFTLSGGEKRRLAFGTILSLNPSFIFFDEPTCALDYSGIELFKKMVRHLKAKGIGIVIVSHFGDIIFELAEEIITLRGGRIVSLKSKRDFFLHEHYSDYLSVPEMVKYQNESFGEIKYFSESELLENS